MSSAKRTNTVAIIGAGEMGAAVGRRMRETKPPIDLNRGPRPRGHYPKTAIGFTEEEDLKQLADSLGSFIDRGLPVSVKEIQNKFGLEQPDPDELILQPMEKLSGQPPASPAPPADADLAPLFTEGAGSHRRDDSFARKTGKHRHSSGLMQRMGQKMQRWRQAVRRRRRIWTRSTSSSSGCAIIFVERLRNHFRRAAAQSFGRRDAAHHQTSSGGLEGVTSYDDLKRRLAQAVLKMDHTDLVNLLARAGFNVALVGQAGVKIHGPNARR